MYQPVGAVFGVSEDDGNSLEYGADLGPGTSGFGEYIAETVVVCQLLGTGHDEAVAHGEPGELSGERIKNASRGECVLMALIST